MTGMTGFAPEIKKKKKEGQPFFLSVVLLKAYFTTTHSERRCGIVSDKN
jgi:hypothetical protein